MSCVSMWDDCMEMAETDSVIVEETKLEAERVKCAHLKHEDDANTVVSISDGDDDDVQYYLCGPCTTTYHTSV